MAVLVTLPDEAVTSAVTAEAVGLAAGEVGQGERAALELADVGVVGPVHSPGEAAQATPVTVRPATAGSARIAPLTGLGPLLVTTRV